MKRLSLILGVVLLASVAQANLKIVTTTTDYADLARQIGGDKVEVRSVMKGPENTHNVLAKPTEMVFLNKADLFVHSGLDAEPWRDNLLRGARNPKVNTGKPGNVDMSQGLDLLDVPAGKIDRSMGDVHAYGNPHFTASPANALRMAATLYKAMANADPANAEFYKANAKQFVSSMADTQTRLKKDLAPYAGMKVVTFHRAWAYFAKDFDIDVVATIEPKPMITPSPAEMKAVVDLMKAREVKIVIVETYNNHAQAKAVADAAGAQLLVLPDHVSGVPEVDSYQKLFEYDVSKLIEAARAAGITPKTIEAAGASTHAD